MTDESTRQPRGSHANTSRTLAREIEQIPVKFLRNSRVPDRPHWSQVPAGAVAYVREEAGHTAQQSTRDDATQSRKRQATAAHDAVMLMHVAALRCSNCQWMRPTRLAFSRADESFSALCFFCYRLAATAYCPDGIMGVGWPALFENERGDLHCTNHPVFRLGSDLYVVHSHLP